MKILVTRHDKIGDFVTMLPVCKVLKEQTDHKIYMLVSKVNVPLAKELDFIDGVIEYSSNKKELIKQIKSHNFDVSISGFIDSDLGYILWRSKIKKRIAPATKLAQIFFNKRLKQRRSQVKKREFEYNLELLKLLDSNLDLNFSKPLYPLDYKREDFIIFHPGFGGSSDGNLSLDEYFYLAQKASQFTQVVFTFGPDDKRAKEYIKAKLPFKNITIKDDFADIVALTHFIAKSKLFISTSTGPMHLAALTNTPTISFFGNTLFASAKRWASVSDEHLQHNFHLGTGKDAPFPPATLKAIEQKLISLLQGK